MKEKRRYKDPLFSVMKKTDIQFAEAMGYWIDLKNNTSTQQKIKMMDKAITERPLNLYLDLYLPENDTLKYRPLIMMLHGGSFYFGTRKDEAISKWCQHFASLGYVAASIDYRVGYIPTLIGIERAGYRAIQDAHAAMRFLVAHQEEYGIDTSLLFVGGSSAGAIAALNLAFMTNDTRPTASYGNHRNHDLGNIEDSGNNLTTSFNIKGVVDMWGALPDTAMIHGKRTPILAFHGDKDDIIPIGHDYPFAKAHGLNKMLSHKMYGSACIIDYAKKHRHLAKLYTFKGYGHAPHIDPETNKLNENFEFIQKKMTAFFHHIIELENKKKKSQ